MNDTYSPIIDINLVANNNEWEMVRITRTRLNEKLISPTLQRLESIWIIDIIDKYTTVRATVERNTQTLESFLTSSIPDLQTQQTRFLFIRILKMLFNT
jgi:hypothetical protein